MSSGYPVSSTKNDAVAVTPSDSATFDPYLDGFFVGTAGAVAVTMLSGAAVTFGNVPSGGYVPVKVTQIKATGTTATNIVGLK